MKKKLHGTKLNALHMVKANGGFVVRKIKVVKHVI